jgi:hypothetical protein
MSFNKNNVYPLWDEMLYHETSQLPKEARERETESLWFCEKRYGRLTHCCHYLWVLFRSTLSEHIMVTSLLSLVFLFLYGLPNEGRSNSGYIASNGRMIIEMYLEERCHVLFWGTLPVFSRKGRRNLKEDSLCPRRDFNGLPAEHKSDTLLFETTCLVTCLSVCLPASQIIFRI